MAIVMICTTVAPVIGSMYVARSSKSPRAPSAAALAISIGRFELDTDLEVACIVAGVLIVSQEGRLDQVGKGEIENDTGIGETLGSETAYCPEILSCASFPCAREKLTNPISGNPLIQNAIIMG